MHSLRAALFALAMLPVAAPATAQAPVAGAATPALDPALNNAIDRLPAILAGGTALDAYFAPSFLQAIPAAQFQAITAQLIAQHGAVGAVSSRRSGPVPLSAEVVVAFARADVTVLLQTATDGQVIGLRIVNIAARNDSIERLTADIAALPGISGWGLYRIADDGSPTLLHGAGNDRPMAIGSVFKLTILGALDEEIAAGRMRWTDVVTLDRQSVPSGISIGWPDGAPVTLHTLAALMISQSDNRATDVLLHHVGRARVEAFARSRGGLSGPHAFPILSTLEATVLKNPAIGEARQRWLGGTEQERRAVLAGPAQGWTPAQVDYSAFSAGPADIDSIEWFASADSIAALLGWFGTQGSEQARAILAINPGIPAAAAGNWSYVGYKGGSEPGVIAFSLLLRARSGERFVASFSWNNAAAAVDEARFVTLASRGAELLRPAD